MRLGVELGAVERHMMQLDASSLHLLHICNYSFYNVLHTQPSSRTFD